MKESDPEPFSIPCTVSPSRPCTRSSLRSICENKSDSEGSSSDGSELQLESTESDNSVTLQSDDDEPVPESEYDFSDDNPVSTVINGKDEVKESSSLPTVPMANIPLVTPPRYNTRASHRSPESDHQELMDHAYALRVQRELQFERSAGSSNKATGSSSSTSNSMPLRSPGSSDRRARSGTSSSSVCHSGNVNQSTSTSSNTAGAADQIINRPRAPVNSSSAGPSNAANLDQPFPPPSGLELDNPRSTMEGIANHPQLDRSVSYSYKRRFQKESRKHFNHYFAASHMEDPITMVDMIVKLLKIPGYMCVKRPKKANAKHQIQRNQVTYAAMTDRITGTQAADAMAQISINSEQETNTELPYTESNVCELVPVAADKEDDITIRKSVGLLRSMHPGRAARTLAQPKQLSSAKATNELINELTSLHPKAKTDTSLCVMPDDPTNMPIELDDADHEKQFRKSVNKIANGSAPGVSGWTGDMLKAIYPDRDCRKGLARLVCDIINGHLPEEAKQYLLPSHLVAVPKPNTVSSIRPISMGEIFYRLAALHAVSSGQGCCCQNISSYTIRSGNSIRM